MAPPTSPLLRLLLRVSLLVGALLDGAVAAIVLATSLGFQAGSWMPDAGVSYSWLLWPALAGRGALQGLACYDRRRYDEAIPWLAVTLVLSGLALVWHDSLPQAPLPSGLVAAYGLTGTLQLITWRRTR